MVASGRREEAPQPGVALDPDDPAPPHRHRRQHPRLLRPVAALVLHDLARQGDQAQHGQAGPRGQAEGGEQLLRFLEAVEAAGRVAAAPVGVGHVDVASCRSAATGSGPRTPGGPTPSRPRRGAPAGPTCGSRAPPRGTRTRGAAPAGAGPARPLRLRRRPAPGCHPRRQERRPPRPVAGWEPLRAPGWSPEGMGRSPAPAGGPRALDDRRHRPIEGLSSGRSPPLGLVPDGLFQRLPGEAQPHPAPHLRRPGQAHPRLESAQRLLQARQAVPPGLVDGSVHLVTPEKNSSVGSRTGVWWRSGSGFSRPGTALRRPAPPARCRGGPGPQSASAPPSSTSLTVLAFQGWMPCLPA